MYLEANKTLTATGGNGRRKMEGFWAARFTGPRGVGNGVVTLIEGRLFGGDSAFLYLGTYGGEADEFRASINIRRFARGPSGVIGGNEFLVEVVGVLEEDKIAAHGRISGEKFEFHIVLIKLAELPERK
jgi:hypothetical protein